MKNESKIKSVIVALGIIFALSIINNIIILNEQVENDGTLKNRDETTFKNLKKSSVYNGGIQIDATLTTNTTYSGNWTWAVSQPWCYDDNGVYVIEDLIINASSSPTGSGIYIENSKNDYFIIKNCTVYNAASTLNDAGIKLENTNNGTLTNNNCSDNGNWGIFLYNYCENNTVSGNTACDNLPLNQDYGIYLLDYCDNNIISGNTVNDNSAYGIYLRNDCNNNNISGNNAGNIFTTNQNFGIYLALSCDNNTISGNTLTDNYEFGIYLNDHSINNNVSGNTANDNVDYGIYLYNGCNNNTISGNTVSNNVTTNQNFGIFLYNGCNNNTISGNSANNNIDYGIYVRDHCDNNIISGNSAYDNNFGIIVREYSINNIISGNSAYDNNYYGIYLYNGCNNNTISRNSASNNFTTNQNFGIYLNLDCDNNTISGNSAYNNSEFGIYLNDHCDNSAISGNSANDNIDYGIYLYNGCNNNTISRNSASNNFTTNQNFGIYLNLDCDNNTISGNTANDNIDIGIRLQYCDDNNIKNNTINRNELGIRLDNSNYNNVSDNILKDNGWCIYEYGCTGNIIENNDCSGSTLQTPIFINGTATGVGAHNWTWAKSQSWCSGQGTYLDPYIIENLKISGFRFEKGIEIINSNVFFIIRGCLIYNSQYGIYLDNVNNSRLIDNNCSNNDYGIYFNYECDNNTISGNTANGNDAGIYFNYECDNNTISGNTANGNYEGIYFYYNCNYNSISGNTAYGNDYGITIYDACYFNKILGNTANGNNIGIYLSSDNEYNEIAENILYNNTWGIDIREGNNNNSVYENFFLKNGKHASDDGTDNKWNSTTIGNYWDNHTGPDTTPQDGIVDYTYTYISGSAESIDYLPIAEDGAPQITINSPSEGDAFNSVAPNFSITITEDYLDTMWYTIDGGLHNYTFTENGIINQSAWDGMDDGGITLTFYARDIPGHIGSASVSIIKDTVAPIIIINSPAEGDSFGNTAPLFNVTVTEDNLDMVWYSFDGGLTTYNITNNTIFNQTAWTALSLGEVTITFYARDLAGNEASESITVIKVLEKNGDEFPFLILIIALISTAGGIGATLITVGILRKRKLTKEVN